MEESTDTQRNTVTIELTVVTARISPARGPAGR